MLPIYDITPFSLIDYPGKVSSIIWFSGCNFQCTYCHNPDLKIKQTDILDKNTIFKFLESRKGLIDGVVLSGGECTLYNIKDLIKEIKALNFKVKIDTNGSNPILIHQLINEDLIDFVALDFKASNVEKFFQLTKSYDYSKFLQTLYMLIQTNVDHEVRTTIEKDIITFDELVDIIKFLKTSDFSKTYYIQNCRDENEKINRNLEYMKDKVEDYIKDKDLKFKIEYRNFNS